MTRRGVEEVGKGISLREREGTVLTGRKTGWVTGQSGRRGVFATLLVERTRAP